MPRLTDAAVRNAAPGPKERAICSEGEPGFKLRIRRSGHKSFVYVYTFDGMRRRMTLGDYDPRSGSTLEAARARYLEAAGKVGMGLDPAAERASTRRREADARMADKRHPSFAGLAMLYIDEHAKRKKRSWREDERIIRADLLPHWGRRKAKDISRADVNQRLDEIAKRGARVMANRVQSLVHKVFNFAIARDLLNGQPNPANLVERRAKEQARERALSDDELRSAWSALDAAPMSRATALALKLILATAQRPGEVLSLEWSAIEGDWWTIQSARAKNGRAHRVYLNETARALLAEARTLPDSERFAFPGAKGGNAPLLVRSVAKAVLRWQQRSAIAPGWTPHDLRRTVATHMGRLGVSRFVQDRVLNHADRTIGAVYDQHDYDREKQKALSQWGRQLSAILTGEPASRNVVPLRPAQHA